MSLATSSPRYRVHELFVDLDDEMCHDFATAAAGVCGANIGMVSVLDRGRQWLIGQHGTDGHDSDPFANSLCARAVASGQTLVVPDASKDPRFREFDAVTAGLRFYAGAVINGPDGQSIGTLCVLDTRPRVLQAQQLQALEALARQLSTAIIRAWGQRPAQHRPGTGFDDPELHLGDRLTSRRSLREIAAIPSLGGTKAGVCLIDVDRMGDVNLALGRAGGDDFLVHLGRRLAEAAHLGDIVTQVGGDEFALLCPHVADADELLTEAGKLADMVNRPYRIGEREIDVTVSIGASFGKLCDSDALLRQAGAAARNAKTSRRGSAAVYGEGPSTAPLDPFAVENELRRALARGELELHYQPIVRLTDDNPVAYEALVRWQHPTRGLLLPEHFLEVAERSDLIVDLGTWVLTQSMHEAALTFDGATDLNVNIAPRQLAQPGFAEMVLDLLARSGLAAERLVLEITETTILDATAEVLLATARLATSGVRIALDDFGTGYSSISALAALPISEVKIDRSFTSHLANDEVKQRLVVGILRLAEANEAIVVAEGVETVDQAELLLQAGCNRAQGYLYGYPTAITAASPVGRRRATP